MIEATLRYVRRTKDLCRYEEEVSDGPMLVGVLYLSKTRLGGAAPKQIKVTIEPIGGSDATD